MDDWSDDILPTQRLPSPDVQTQSLLTLLQRSFEYRVKNGLNNFGDLLVDLNAYSAEEIRLLLTTPFRGIPMIAYVAASGISLARYTNVDVAMSVDKENDVSPVRRFGK